MYGSLRGDSESALCVLAAVILRAERWMHLLLEGWLEVGKGSCQWHHIVCHVGDTLHTGGLLDHTVKLRPDRFLKGLSFLKRG